MDARLKVLPESEARFRAALERMARSLPYEGKKIIELAAVSYTRAARNTTPTAKRNAKREIVTRPWATGGFSKRGWQSRPGTEYGVRVLSQRNPPKDLWLHGVKSASEAKRHPLAVVPNIGAAKKSWYGVLRSLGKAIGVEAGRSASFAKWLATGPKAALLLVNRLSYLLKIAPNVDAEAKRRAAKDIEIKVERAIYGAWGRAA